MRQETSFKEKVFKTVKKIPKGRILTYEMVAKLAGRPRAWRVVGNILNKNRDLKIPCHRVIRSDGKVGGFNRETKNKISLLKAEGIVIRNRRVVHCQFQKR